MPYKLAQGYVIRMTTFCKRAETLWIVICTEGGPQGAVEQCHCRVCEYSGRVPSWQLWTIPRPQKQRLESTRTAHVMYLHQVKDVVLPHFVSISRSQCWPLGCLVLRAAHRMWVITQTTQGHNPKYTGMNAKVMPYVVMKW